MDDLLTSEIQNKDAKAIGEGKHNKCSNLECPLAKKIGSVKHPMQELKLNYLMTLGKVWSKEEDQSLLCWLNHYGMQAEDEYKCIKQDISKLL
ncbi:hypothetical protein JVU11DRAFT_10933 [Chiua virens]|nr:hypothetical protein JVU11DRAFT_10933 [Chiua virens]